MTILILFLLLLLPHGVTGQDLKHSVIAGYQGWFSTSCDSEHPFWRHWGGASPTPGNVTFELFPDMREFAAGDVCATGLANLGNGSPDTLYAAGRAGVINKHFEWMQQYGIDGVAVQRFLSETFKNGAVMTPDRAWRDQTLQRVRTAAEANGRVFYVMMDISGSNAATLVADFQNDVTHIEGLSGNPMGSANYLKQDGKPVISIWGCGFSDRPCSVSQAQTLIAWLKGRGYYVYGGIPGDWRSGSYSAWDSTFLMYDMVAPWTVGGYRPDVEIDGYFTNAAAEKSYAEANGIAYQNIMWPGFSWINWNGGLTNWFPRNAGAFLWRQAYRMKENGATSAYIAMFDEFDEGTAIAKAAENSSMIPTNQYFLTLDADGYTICSDYYLRLSGAATAMIKGQEIHSLDIPVAFCTTQAQPPLAPTNLRFQ